ncbi:alpha/beta hydrolase [Thermomonospora umbrina]|uniref:Alpha/beta hydrolase family protein n=1 Tax=Thermomonospora umbrina TaxID=111806 RepID=A0A3D9SS15_9ACTN|nr:alpha/beta hydrolase [Thermomonospora umbrina]REE95414.1 alpha/beta hydrolase family protein [Thermomonospora umbrina]
MRSRAPALLAALAVVTSTAADASPPDPYAAPGPRPAPTAGTLDARYADTHRDIATALNTAREAGDDDRERALSGLLRPGRRFLSFDARGRGRAVEVFGDLIAADRVAIVVPGADGTLNGYDSWKFAGGGARSLHEEARRVSPGGRLAVIAWLGYASPATLSTDVLTVGRADDASRGLRRFVTEIRRVNGSASLALLCHSYGSVVCAKAARHVPAQDIALFGSPGTGVRRASDLRTRARVWAGRAGGDWMSLVPNVRFFGVGFGTDPTERSYGARVFDAGSGRHSGYLKPGSTSLHSLTLIALGRTLEVPRA